MADIKTHLRELSVATTVGLLSTDVIFYGRFSFGFSGWRHKHDNIIKGFLILICSVDHQFVFCMFDHCRFTVLCPML